MRKIIQKVCFFVMASQVAFGQPKPSGNVTDEKPVASQIPSGQELVNIDFPDETDIKDIIRAVSLWTGKNVILDRQVSGKVQIISPRRVTKEEAYQAFLSALNLLGLTTVETGKVIKIMPIRQAIKGNLKTYTGTNWTPLTDETITQIFPLKYISAKEIQKTLTRIVTSNAMIAYEDTNTLIVSDSGYKIRRIRDIISLLDVQGQQPQVSIVPIKYADSKGISDRVSQIFKQTTGNSRGNYNTYKILSDDRTNSVVIFGPPRTIADVKSLVKKFDVPLDDPTKQSTIHVRPLDYADAKKLAATLHQLANGSKRTSTIRRPPISSSKSKTTSTTSESPKVAELEGNVKITADESSNSLIITGSHAAYSSINSIIRKLDVRKSQVFVETDILDLNLQSGFNLGTSIFAGRPPVNGAGIATTWEAGGISPLITAQAQTNSSRKVTGSQIESSAGVFSQDLTVGILSGTAVNVEGLGEIRPGALIRMIKSDANTRVLSTPHLLTSNNEEATISVGEKIYFRNQSIAGTTGVVENKVEDEEVALTLTIKPNISHSGYVTMEIDLDNSSAQIDAKSGLPIVSTRKTKQLVTLKNSQTVVMSGLIQNSKFEQFKKVPLFGDIPILGWLFRNSNISSIKTNLLIFLTPHVIHGADDLAAVYKRKIKERDDFLEAMYGSDVVESDFYASLPTLSDGEFVPDEKDKREIEYREKMMQELQNTENLKEEEPQYKTSPKTVVVPDK